MEVDTTTWTVGFVIAGVVVVVVVAVVLGIIAFATRIRNQVRHIIAALRDAESNTDALWEAHTTVRTGHEVLDLAVQARHQLEA
jgi:hypothetical protein